MKYMIYALMYLPIYIYISAVKWLIMINRIQNKSFCLHHTCKCTVFIYYVYKYTHILYIYLTYLHVYTFTYLILLDFTLYVIIFNI